MEDKINGLKDWLNDYISSNSLESRLNVMLENTTEEEILNSLRTQIKNLELNKEDYDSFISDNTLRDTEVNEKLMEIYKDKI